MCWVNRPAVCKPENLSLISTKHVCVPFRHRAARCLLFFSLTPLGFISLVCRRRSFMSTSQSRFLSRRSYPAILGRRRTCFFFCSQNSFFFFARPLYQFYNSCRVHNKREKAHWLVSTTTIKNGGSALLLHTSVRPRHCINKNLLQPLTNYCRGSVFFIESLFVRASFTISVPIKTRVGQIKKNVKQKNIYIKPHDVCFVLTVVIVFY